MGERAVELKYESWCEECQKVSTHFLGTCQEHTQPVGFPRPAILVPLVPRRGRAA
jgi:hypothetical protein